MTSPGPDRVSAGTSRHGLVRWIVFLAVLAGAGLLAGRPGTGGYVLCELTLIVAGLLAVLLAVTSLLRRGQRR